jgi:hypothetical protein
MRGLLRRIGARAGISLGLVLLIAAVVAIARVAGGAADRPSPNTGPATTPSAAVEGDDGAVTPVPTAPTDDTAVLSAVTTFMEAWLQREATPEAWYAELAPLCTEKLRQNLAGVDPRGVPATRTVGESKVVLRSSLYAQVDVPVDSGTVLLGLLQLDGAWLVDTLDWERV